MQITYNLLCYFYRKKNKVIFHRNVTGTETEMRLKALLNFELNKVSKNMISLPPLLFWSKFQSIWPLCFLICGLQGILNRNIRPKSFFMFFSLNLLLGIYQFIIWIQTCSSIKPSSAQQNNSLFITGIPGAFICGNSQMAALRVLNDYNKALESGPLFVRKN